MCGRGGGGGGGGGGENEEREREGKGGKGEGREGRNGREGGKREPWVKLSPIKVGRVFQALTIVPSFSELLFGKNYRGHIALMLHPGSFNKQVEVTDTPNRSQRGLSGPRTARERERERETKEKRRISFRTQ